MKLKQNKNGWYYIDGLQSRFDFDDLPVEIKDKFDERVRHHDWVESDYAFGKSPSRESLFEAVLGMNAAVGTLQIPLYELGERFDDSGEEIDRLCFKTIEDMLMWLGLEFIQNSTRSIYDVDLGETTLSIPIKGANSATVKLPSNLSDDEARRAIKTTLSTLKNYYDIDLLDQETLDN